MAELPTPITNEGYRILDTAAYQKRVLNDELMKDIKTLIDFGTTAFKDLDNLIDLTDVDSIKAKTPNMVLPKGFIPMEPNAASFYLSGKPHNGLRSLRRGFYQLLPDPELIPVLDFKVWSMDVLFCEGPYNNTIYKYNCNVGPLLNKFAVRRDLMSKKFMKIPMNNKRQSLYDLTRKVIYVSNAELTYVDETLKPYETKEVLWFTW